MLIGVTAVAATVAGCGLQGASKRGAVTVTVTENFGTRQVGVAMVDDPSGGASALALTKRRFKVTSAGDGVGTIAGLSGGGARRWSLYVNGVAARGRTFVYAGDRVWWDLHASPARPEAVVGSFPEPFVHGLGGRRLPAALECGSGMGRACGRVAATLTRLRVPVASQLLGTGSGQDSLTVEVATWPQLRGQLVALLLARGPGESGVFARFAGAGGNSLDLLTGGGALAGTVGPSAGLVAAVDQGQGPPTWLITGTDAAGVQAAAEAFDAGSLRDRFALVIAHGRDLPVPR